MPCLGNWCRGGTREYWRCSSSSRVFQAPGMPRIIQSDGSGIPAPFVSGRFQSECCGFKGPLFPHIYTRTRPAFKYPHISSLYFHLSPSSTALLTDRPTNRLPGACVCACCVRLLKLSVSFLVHKPHQLLFVVCRCVCVLKLLHHAY